MSAATPAAGLVAGRGAPVAAGTGIPADRHEAYRRGLCRTCRVAPHSAGRTRCEACHVSYLAGSEAEERS